MAAGDPDSALNNWPPAAAAERVRRAVENPDLLRFAGSQKLVQHQLISLLLDMLHDSVPERAINLTHATHCDIVRRSQAIVLASSDEPVTVLDLCQQLRISRRTLQNSFQLIANTTPVDYLRPSGSMRCGACCCREHAGFGVRDAAGHWGFYHLGHFARDYRKLFCELPSETRQPWPAAGRVAVISAHAAQRMRWR
jgi:transcriptional regulator GlxA family with amidase domain